MNAPQFDEARMAVRLQTMLTDSGITDAEPGSMTVRPAPGGHDVYVVSRSGGSVRVGSIPFSEMALEAELRQSGDRWRGAREKRRSNHRRNVARAAELRLTGLTPAQIAKRMTAERNDPERPDINVRTVQKWLAKHKGTPDPQ